MAAMSIKKMAVKDWINVPDNPRQRDTVRHARKAKRTHLSTTEDPHKIVFATMMDGVVKWKLDGHTRAFLWENGELPCPAGKLTVVCFEVPNVVEAKRLYSMFDNQAATENACDRLSGACREHNLALASPLLRSHRFVVALQIATGEKVTGREYDYVKLWRTELDELDSWNLSAGLPAALIALALALIGAGEQKAERFFKLFDNDDGTKTTAGSDGVQMLATHFLDRQAANKPGKGNTLQGWDNIQDFFERGLTCFNVFKLSRRQKGGPRRTKRDTLQLTKQLPPIKKKSVAPKEEK